MIKKFTFKPMLLMLALFCGALSMNAAVEKITFSEKGYANQEEVAAVAGTYFNVVFDKGSNQNPPKYYDNNVEVPAVRVYGGGTFTVSAKSDITKIELTFGSGDKENAIEANGGNFDGTVWTGTAKEVVFTIDGTSGHRRIAAIEVTTAGDEQVDPIVEKQAADLAFPQEAYEVNLGDAFTAPALTNPNKLAVTYSSSNEKVATVDEDGAVTIVGAGTTTIKASFEGDDNFKAGSASYKLTVKDTTPVSEDPAGTITFSKLGLENGVQYTDPFDAGTFTVTFGGGGNDGKYYNVGEGIRVYGGGTMTIKTKKGNITKLTISYDGTNKPDAADVVDGGTYDVETGVWTGDAATVVFTRPTGTGHWRIQKIVAEVKDGTAPVDPVEDEAIAVSVADFNAAEESTEVWYQLTGVVKNLKDNDQYGNFDIEDATGSVYVYGLLSEKGGAKKQFAALAKEKGIQNGSKLTIIGNRGSFTSSGETKIEVTNAYFVSVDNTGVDPIVEPELETVETFADFKKLEENTTVLLKFNNAQVYYVDGKNMYIGDGTASIDFYDTGFTYTAGQRLTGTVKATWAPYKGLPEAKYVSVEGELTVVDGEPQLQTVAIDDLSEDYLCTLIEVSGTMMIETDESGKTTTIAVVDEEGHGVALYDTFKNKSLEGLKDGDKVVVKGIYYIFNGNYQIAPISISGPTGVKAVVAQANQGTAIFNIAGQRVMNAQKGLYIINGKKVVK